MEQTLPLRFGAFMPPAHKVGLNPTLAMGRAVELAQHLERLGYDEIWFGEHHSGGVEISGSPELMIATAAAKTERIRLGAGVISVPYHHPFMVAERLVQLDHLTKGRVIFGAGPGQLNRDARMLGIDPLQLRPRMEEGLDAIMRLLRGEVVTETTDWYSLVEAELQLRPFAGSIETAVAGAFSPSGPKLAGRYGTSLLSLAATEPAAVDLLAGHWDVMQEEAKQYGQTVDRANWRLLGPMHIAETVDEAKKQCRYGLKYIYDYLAHVSPGVGAGHPTSDGYADALNASGQGVIGTPEMAIAQIERLIEKSGKGFGTFLFNANDFARFDDQKRSYELFAEEVMPHFQGQIPGLKASYDEAVSKGAENIAEVTKAIGDAEERYAAEKAAR